MDWYVGDQIHVMSLYPWLIDYWTKLITLKKEKKVPHALLLTGNGNYGQRDFSIQWAKKLLCKEESSCSGCRNCHLMEIQAHPDFLLVEPEQSGGMIKIDQIREIIQFTSETALQSPNRVIVICPATSMNIYSANALLKSLEEPPPHTFFILVNDGIGRLAPTLLSRCQRLVFHKPKTQEVLSWLEKNTHEDEASLKKLLKLTGGDPIKTKTYLDSNFLSTREKFLDDFIELGDNKKNPLELAAEYQDQDIKIVFFLLMQWVQDLLGFRLTNGQTELLNADFSEKIAHSAPNLSNQKLLAYYDYLSQTSSYFHSNLNLNRQYVLEDLFIRWAEK